MPRYDAFISYSHAKDKPVADALQGVMQKLGKPWYKRRALRVFRDDTSLSASPELWAGIEAALSASRYLVLLTSPEAAKSPWVKKEIAWWLEHKAVDTLLIAHTAGADIDWDTAQSDFVWSKVTPLPSPLKGSFNAEPFWVDLREWRYSSRRKNAGDRRFQSLAAALAAKIHGRPKEDLLSDEFRQQKRALRLAGAAVVAVSGLFIAALWQFTEATKERDRTLISQSLFVAEKAGEQRNARQISTAILLSLEALPDEAIGKVRPPVPEAEQILRQTVCAERCLKILEVRDDLELRDALDEAQGALDAVFGPNGARVVTAHFDTTARIWDSSTGTVIAVLKGHSGEVATATFSPDGARIVTASEDSTARLWDARTGATIAELKGHGGYVLRAVFSRDGARVVTASFDKKARLWDGRTGAEIAILQGHEDTVWSARFSPNGARVVTASDDKTARLWDGRTGAEIAILQGHDGKVRSARFSPNGARVVTASDDKTARLWDTRTGAEIAVLKGHASAVQSARFSADGTRIVTTTSRFARLWDGQTGAEVAVLKGQFAAISPDGDRLVTTEDTTARLWYASSGTVIALFSGHRDGINGAEFSPDGTRIVTWSYDTTVRIWDAEATHGAAGPISHADMGGGVNRKVAQDWRVFPTTQAVVDHAKTLITRCLTPDQRENFHLSPTPPRWCYERKLWPYHDKALQRLWLHERLVRIWHTVADWFK